MSRKSGPSIEVHGLGLGTAIAVCISYTAYKSIGWAIVHGICSWFYVLYYMCTK